MNTKRTAEYEPTIGLEIHAELATPTKLFCGCKNDPFHAPEPNIYICPVCLGLPGALPVMNRQALEWAAKVGLALGGTVGHPGRANSQERIANGENDDRTPDRLSLIADRYSKWDRKNYFYPDLPKGYQISQYDLPLAHGGALELPASSKIAITRIHLEEDTGKLLHPAGADYSLIDYNRSGVPLLELVTEPEIRSGAEAAEFAETYQLVLRTLGVANADMEKGEMRAEVNISLRLNSKLKTQNSKLGTKVEIKNLNSFRSVQKSIDYEIKRQTEILERGDKVAQETRGWDENQQRTFSQRTKETAADYRYFPEPDLPPITVIDGGGKSEIRHRRNGIPPRRENPKSETSGGIDIVKICAQLPEMPWEREARYMREGVVVEDARRLVRNPSLMDKYERLGSRAAPEQKKSLAGWLVNNVFYQKETDFARPELDKLVEKLIAGQINLARAKAMRAALDRPGASLTKLLAQEMSAQPLAADRLGSIIEDVISAHPQAVRDWRAGQTGALSFLVGQVMVKTRGAADPRRAASELKRRLKEE